MKTETTLNDPLLEQAVIATLLVSGDRIDEVKKLVELTTFTTFKYQEIYKAMLAVSDKGLPVDTVTVWGEAKTAVRLTDLTEALVELPDDLWRDSTLTGLKLADHCQVLRSLEIKRQIAQKIRDGEKG